MRVAPSLSGTHSHAKSWTLLLNKTEYCKQYTAHRSEPYRSYRRNRILHTDLNHTDPDVETEYCTRRVDKTEYCKHKTKHCTSRDSYRQSNDLYTSNAGGFCLSVGTPTLRRVKTDEMGCRHIAVSPSSALSRIGSEAWNIPKPQCAPYGPN